MFLDRDARSRHFLILAGSGAGKTIFALNYYLHTKKKPKKKRGNLVLIPLSLQNADQLILSSSDKKNSVLFLDGFDEDTSAGNHPYQRLRQIFNLAKSYRKIIITCSINFFPKTHYVKSKQGFEIIGPVDQNDDHIYELKKVYLSPMTLTEAKKILNANLPFGKAGMGKQIVEFIKSNASIGVTPFILSYFDNIYSKTPGLASISDVYKAIIHAWVGHQKNWKDKALLYQFLRHLAIDLFLERFNRGEEAIPLDALEHKTRDWGISLRPFKRDKKSLINQNKSGTLRFSHRSIMEYLFIEQLISGEKSCYKVYLTTNMKKLLFEFFKNSQPLDLSHEFLWLSQFKLKAHGLKITVPNKDKASQKNLFYDIIDSNNQYKFLARLNKILKNPIFYEFGWEASLNDNLKLALFQSESSLLYLNRQKWQVLIDPKIIEITKHGQKIQKILFREKDVMEYSSLENDLSLARLNRTIGLSGLKMLNHINRTGFFAVLPELKNPDRFTIYFK
ncbi:MAG: hypothetical protein L3J69_01925 [Desulfobacula sp.]|nr:hypothetical protein [Desulfobacula sp.]